MDKVELMRHFKIRMRSGLALVALMLTFGAEANELVIGQAAPLSGPEATLGRSYSAGLQLALNHANAAGGVNGHTFALAVKDDRSMPAETISATRQLLAESRPLVLAGYFGDANLAELIKTRLLETENIALVGYRINEMRAQAPLVYNVRAGLLDEVSKMVEHLATVGITKLGFFYQDGPPSAALVAAVEEMAKGKNARLVVKGFHAAGTAKVTSEVIDTFIAAAPQAIILVSSSPATGAFIEKYRATGGAAQLLAHSSVDIEQISRRLGEEHMRGVAITQVTPSPYKISGKLTKTLVDLAAKRVDQTVPVSYAMMEGYITGALIVESARRMGPKVSREGFVKALEGIDDYDLGGYKLGFKPNQRSGSRFVEMTIVTSTGRIRQ